MENTSSSTYIFSPRPDAYDMDWEDLLPPVRKAVRDLLLRLDGAACMVEDNMRDKEKNKPQMTTANCFLVHGDRGTGKTTVLLSAKRACNSKLKDTFFGKEIPKDNIPKEVYKDAKKSAEELQEIIWLDLLDLEPLPPKTNLLTTVLTRVRNALYPSDTEDSSIEATSILEERADSARHKLDLLIKDAALMWEDIEETDTRSRANRQVAAADIYSKFQKNFRKAMDALTQELAHRSTTGKSHVQIVLPIDNIDRSTEHLYSIVKLAQMVSCHRFWLVLAGDRQDVETFLERAYWKELIRIGKEGAGATGKTGIGGEDEALVMARRQAAAASHKLLPPSHRVEVGLVSAEETLNFKPSNMSGNDQNISELLGAVRLVTEVQIKKEEKKRKAQESKTPNTTDNKTGNHSENDQLNLELIDLFDARRLMQYIIQLDGNAERKDEAQSHAAEGAGNDVNNDKTATQTDNNSDPEGTKKNAATASGTPTKELTQSYLTDAAQLGLRLPARGVLDLWQLAYWVTTDPTIKEHRRAETIARTMLRNVITESNMPSEIGRLLQEQIIRRTHQDGTLLDFQGPKTNDELLDVSRVLSLDFTLPKNLYPPTKTNGELHQEYSDESYMVESHLEVMQNKTFNLRLMYPSRQQNEGGKNKEPELFLLPDLVAAWLTILHDTLAWGAEDSEVIGIDPNKLRPDIVLSRHNAIPINCSNLHNQNNLGAESLHSWPSPSWPSFIAHDVFLQFWNRFLKKFEDDELPNLLTKGKVHARLLVAGWVLCVLETFLTYSKLWGWECPEDILKGIYNDISSIKESIFNQAHGSKEENTENVKTEEEKNEEDKTEKKNIEKLIKDTEIELMKAASCAYKQLTGETNEVNYHAKKLKSDTSDEDYQAKKLKSDTSGEDYRAHQARWIMREWLEYGLPYLLSYLFVPLPITETTPTTRAHDIITTLMTDKNINHDLGNTWKTNLHFIGANIGRELEQLYSNTYIIYQSFKPFNDFDALINQLNDCTDPKLHSLSNDS